MARHLKSYTWSVCLLLTVVACSGSVSPVGGEAAPSDKGGNGGSGPKGDAGEGGMVDAEGCALPARRLRLLTPEQMENALAALFPSLGTLPKLDLPRPGRGPSGFSNDSDRLSLTVADVQKFFGAMTAVAEAAAAKPAALDGCLASGLGNETCLRGFLDRFVAKAFRRPPDPAQVDALLAFAKSQKAGHGDAGALSQTLRRVLMAPEFMFRSEIGKTKGDVAELDAHEKASALSFTLTDGPPDDALLEAARSGELDTPEGLRSQAERLLNEPESARGVMNLFSELFRTSSMAGVVKDDVFKGWSPQIASDTRREAEAFIAEVMWSDDHRLETLLTAPYTMVNQRLAKFYGLEGADGLGEAFEKLSYGKQPRAGILGQGGLLSLLAHAGQNDVVRRGRFVREEFLCEAVPPPPPNVVAVPPPPEGDITLRQALEQHQKDPACAVCHSQMDDIGFALEAFDGVGRHRTSDNGKPIDARGQIVGSESSDGHFDGEVELSVHLAKSDQVKRCFAKHGFRFVFGRLEQTADSCQLDKLSERFIAGGGDLRALLLDFVASPGFSRRAAALD